MNRGIARRSLFEDRRDVRGFLAGIARAVRGGRLEVHAFCVMTTHFHLLVRSPVGALSEVMRQVQLDHARRFNRGRKRDGPLFRGRFTSKPVSSLTYRRTLVRYIDRNPVSARLCTDPREYPFGSAASYARSSGPIWLAREWVEEVVRATAGSDAYDPQAYERAFGRLAAADEALVERRIACPAHADPLDDLVNGNPAGVLAWMRRKARLADGTDSGMPVAAASCILEAIRRERARGLDVLRKDGKRPLGTQLEAGLLRALTGASLAEIGNHLGKSVSTAGELCRRHDESLFTDEAYARHASRLGRLGIALQFEDDPHGRGPTPAEPQ